MISQNDLDWFAARLSIAVHETNRITPEMSAFELREALKDVAGAEDLTISRATNGNQVIHLGDKALEVSPTASNDEIIAALQNPFIRTENTHMSITGYEPGTIQAKLAEIKQKAAERRKQSLAKLDAAFANNAKVDDMIEAQAGQIDKETNDALQEFALTTNGGPA